MAVGFALGSREHAVARLRARVRLPDTGRGMHRRRVRRGSGTAAFLVAGRVAGSRRRMAVTLALLGVGIVAFSLAPWLPLGFVFLFFAGFGYLASNTSATTRLQLGRGRVRARADHGALGVAFLGLRPVASLVDGAIAATLGVRVAGVILALPALAGAALILLVVGRRGTRSADPVRT